MLSLRHPVHELRERVQRGDPGDRPPPAPTHVVVYRDERCFLRSVAVEPLAAALVDSLLGGGSLGDACESVARASGLDPAVLGAPLVGWFQQWTASGWIRGVRF
jgi:hypothetical protein